MMESPKCHRRQLPGWQNWIRSIAGSMLRKPVQFGDQIAEFTGVIWNGKVSRKSRAQCFQIALGKEANGNGSVRVGHCYPTLCRFQSATQ